MITCKVLYVGFHLYEVQEWARIQSDRSQNSGLSLARRNGLEEAQDSLWDTRNKSILLSGG